MPVACVRVPCFALRIALLDQPHLDGYPLILSNPESGRAIVIDATAGAVTLGVRNGMQLREATALCPDAIVFMPDPVRESLVAQAIRHRLEEISPFVEPDVYEAGCWYVDLAGLERLCGPPEVTARRLLACIEAILRPRAGVAPGMFAARVVTESANSGDVRVIGDQANASFLTAAPVTSLPLPAETIHQLQRLGITTLGALASLPGRKVAARFGPAGRHAWDLAHGHDDRRVTPPPRTQSVVEDLTMPTPAISRGMLLFGLRQLVRRAFARPALRDRHVRELTLRAIIEGERRSWERTLTLKEPCGANRVIAALDLRLQTLDLPGPVEEVSLEFSGISDAVARQEAFPLMGARATAPLTAAIAQLKQRYGLSPLFHVVEVEPWSRIPERRHALISYDP